MKLKFRKVVILLICISILTSVMVQAKTLSNKESNNSSIVVEILYNVNGNNFAENIAFEDGTNLSDYNYIIEYKPMLLNDDIGKYFNFAAWIVRDGVRSLSLDPTSDVRKYRSYRDDAWNLLSDEVLGFGGSLYWNNTQVMQWQFNCHYSFAKSKEYWNLEPHRNASNYLQVVFSGCNP